MDEIEKLVHETVRTDPQIEFFGELQVEVWEACLVIPLNTASWNITADTIPPENALLAQAPWFVVVSFLFFVVSEIWVLLQKSPQSIDEDLVTTRFVEFLIRRGGGGRGLRGRTHSWESEKGRCPGRRDRRRFV